MNRRKTAAPLTTPAQPTAAHNPSPASDVENGFQTQQVAQIARRLQAAGGSDTLAPAPGFTRLQATLGNQAMLRLLRLNNPAADVQRAPDPQNIGELLEEDAFENPEMLQTLQEQWMTPGQSSPGMPNASTEGGTPSRDDPILSEEPETFDPDFSTNSPYEDPLSQTSRDPEQNGNGAAPDNEASEAESEQTVEGEQSTGPVSSNASPAPTSGAGQPMTPPAPTTPSPASRAGEKPPAGTAGLKTPAARTDASDPVGEMASPEPESGDNDLVNKELAEHDRWGKYGAPGSDERKAWVRENVAAGVGEGIVSGLAMGVGVQGVNKAVEWAFKKHAVRKMGETVGKQAIKHMPVPAVGAVVGGLLSSYNLVTRDWAGNWKNMTKGFTLEGNTTYEKIANLLQGISDLVDIMSNVLNVVAGVAGAIAAGSWLLTIASAGALTPVAAAATSFATVVSIITGVMDMVNGFVIQPGITAFRAMDAMDMDADPLAMEKAAKDIRGAAAGPGAAFGAYAATPNIKGGQKFYENLQKARKADTSSQTKVQPTGTQPKTPGIAVQPNGKNAPAGPGSDTPASSTSAADAGTAPKAQTETPAPTSQSETVKPPAAQPEAPPPASTQSDAPVSQPDTAKTPADAPAARQSEGEAKTGAETQPEAMSKSDEPSMKPDEKPPSTREEAETRLRDNQAKRDALQKEIDAHEKTMKDAAGKMKDMMLRQKALDEKIKMLSSEADAAGKIRDQKWRAAEAADKARYKAEEALHKAQLGNNPEATAAAQQEIASQREAAAKARAEYQEAAAQEQKARVQAIALADLHKSMGVDAGWDVILFDQAAADRARLLEQQALIDADITTTKQTLEALDSPAKPQEPQPPVKDNLAGAHGDESRRLSEQHQKLVEENQRLKDEKAKIEAERKKKNADQDALDKQAEENQKRIEENDSALETNAYDQMLHHYPKGTQGGQRHAVATMGKWAKREQSWGEKVPGFMQPPPSFNANNLGGSAATEWLDPWLYSEGDDKGEAEEKSPEVVTLSPAYADPPATPEAIDALRQQAGELEVQHQRMTQIEQGEAEEQAKGEAQKAEAEDAVTQSKAMLDLNREHGQKTTAGAEANKQQGAENAKAEKAVDTYNQQSGKFGNFQSVLETVLGLEYLLDMLPDRIANSARSMFRGAHTMYSTLAQMNSGMGQVAAAGPQQQQAIDDKEQRFEQVKQENAGTDQQLQQNDTGAQKLKADNEEKTALAAQNRAEAQASDAEILDMKAEKQNQADELDAQMQLWAEQHYAAREQVVNNAAANAATNGYDVLEVSY